MRDFLVRMTRPVLRYLPLVLMIWGVGFALFFTGFLVGDLRRGPFSTLEGARQAAMFVWNRKLFGNGLPELRDPSDLAPADVAKHRIVAREPVQDGSALLLTGGPGQFLDYCPDQGCAAVILKRDGTLIHAYPYRPEELITKRIVDLPYAQFMHDDVADTAVFGLAPLPNGDLIVAYDFSASTPYGGGIARMDRDGHLLWYRRDYSNHWPKLTPDNQILVISDKIGPRRLPIYLHEGKRRYIETLNCDSGFLLDLVRVLDLDGKVKEEISLFDALNKSPYWSRLLVDTDPLRPLMSANLCDPIHANSVVLAGPELAAKFADVQPDDLLVSLRNLSAVVIVGRRDHALKHMFRGSFVNQHSAQVIPGGKIMLFDNLGSGPEGGPSRVLVYDPATGSEHTILPNANMPRDVELFSPFFGNIDLSPDGTRALVTASTAGKAYEFRIADGAILTDFNNVHDLSTVPKFAKSAKPVRYFTEYGVYYVPPDVTGGAIASAGSVKLPVPARNPSALVETVSFETSKARVVASLASITQEPGIAGSEPAPAENLTGSKFDDALTGSPEGNVIRGLDGDDYMDGGAGDDMLIGGPGDDTLIGGGGDDMLIGGAGHDTLSGGAGADVFVMAAPVAADAVTITDFAHGIDKIEFDAADYRLAPGPLDADNLVIGEAATGDRPEFIYDPNTGRLSWDADGRNALPPVAIASLPPHAALSASDLLAVQKAALPE